MANFLVIFKFNLRIFYQRYLHNSPYAAFEESTLGHIYLQGFKEVTLHPSSEILNSKLFSLMFLVSCIWHFHKTRYWKTKYPDKFKFIIILATSRRRRLFNWDWWQQSNLVWNTLFFEGCPNFIWVCLVKNMLLINLLR